MGVETIIIGMQSDNIASLRKILEDVQYHVRRIDYKLQEDEEGKKVVLDETSKTSDKTF